MRSLRLSRDVTGAVNVLLIVLIAVLMVSASTVVILIYQGGQSEEGSSDIVAAGQTIKVNYTGKLLDGRVFDTSYLTVANDDANYPKTLSFTKRSDSSYAPLSFQVGAGKMISGFDAAVVGMKIGETKTVTLSPDEAYGDMDPSKLVTFQLTENVPLLKVFTSSAFQAEYGVDPAYHLMVTDPRYGWDAIVEAYDEQADRVNVKNVPTIDSLYHIYGTGSVGWDVKVTAMDSNSGLITIQHQLDDADSDMIKGLDGTSTFFITGVDQDGGTAMRNYNTELLGKSLVFTITIVSIVE